MQTQVSTFLRRATIKPLDRLNILSFATHERYQTNLSKTGHNFYLLQGEGIKTWCNDYAPLPPNHIILENTLPPHIVFDAVLSQNKGGQYPVAVQIASSLQLPLITLEHCLPPPNWKKHQLESTLSMYGHINVFISEYNQKAWGLNESNSIVIPHGVDTDVFKPQEVEKPPKPYALSVVNDWINRDWCCGMRLWQEITGFPQQELVPVKVLGNTPGLSLPAPSIPDLVTEYNKCGVFLNTSLVSPVPSVLLEAMACGKCIVSTATCMIPEFIQHGVNGYMSNDPVKLRNYCLELLNDPDKADYMGRKARETILEKFSLGQFVDNWNNVFKKVVA